MIIQVNFVIFCLDKAFFLILLTFWHREVGQLATLATFLCIKSIRPALWHRQTKSQEETTAAKTNYPADIVKAEFCLLSHERNGDYMCPKLEEPCLLALLPPLGGYKEKQK